MLFNYVGGAIAAPIRYSCTYTYTSLCFRCNRNVVQVRACGIHTRVYMYVPLLRAENVYLYIRIDIRVRAPVSAS